MHFQGEGSKLYFASTLISFSLSPGVPVRSEGLNFLWVDNFPLFLPREDGGKIDNYSTIISFMRNKKFAAHKDGKNNRPLKYYLQLKRTHTKWLTKYNLEHLQDFHKEQDIPIPTF